MSIPRLRVVEQHHGADDGDEEDHASGGTPGVASSDLLSRTDVWEQDHGLTAISSSVFPACSMSEPDAPVHVKTLCNAAGGVDWTSPDAVASHVCKTTLQQMQQIWRSHAASMDTRGREFAEKVYHLHSQALQAVAQQKTFELKAVTGVINSFTNGAQMVCMLTKGCLTMEHACIHTISLVTPCGIEHAADVATRPLSASTGVHVMLAWLTWLLFMCAPSHPPSAPVPIQVQM